MAQQPKTEVMGRKKINWWLVLAGVVLVLFAVAAFLAPFVFLEFVALWAGIGFLFSGVMGFISFWNTRHLPNSGWALFMAVLDVVVGVLMVMHPFTFAPMLPWILGLFFIVFGALQVGGTVPLGQRIPESRSMMVVSGVLAIVVGIMFIIWPSSLSIWVAAFALIRGITLVAAGFTSRVE